MTAARSRRSAPRTRRRGIQVALSRRLTPVLMKLLSTQQQHRRSQFAALEVPPGRVVLLGDSISEFGLWDEWFPDVPVLNRGIGGETTAQVLARLDTAIRDPAAVLLLVGTNDLTGAVDEAVIAANIGAILRGIEQRAPGTPVWVQSVMPRTLQYRDELRSLNRRIERLVAAAPPHVHHIDLWPVLATDDGRLEDAYSLDHLHLTGAGYRAWVELLRAVVPPLSPRHLDGPASAD